MPWHHGLPPLVFEPIYKEKIWGGSALERRLDKNIPVGINIGESWELSAVPGDESKSVSVPFTGQSLPFIFSQEKERLVGSGGGSSFPLLFKFIDSNDKLSVQVHPSDGEAAGGAPARFGKTECWFIVDALPEARLICGFREGVSLADVKNLTQSDKLPELCNFLPVRAGDVVFVPAGTVHALLPGVLVYEVQQTSDTTYRLYDWGRTYKTNMPRPLHIKEGLNALDMRFHDKHKIPPVIISEKTGAYHALRVVCRYFALEEYRLNEPRQFELEPKKSFRVLTVIDGSIKIPGFGIIGKGQTVLLPASTGKFSVSSETFGHFLSTSVPHINAEIVKPLLRQGVTREAITELGGNPFRNDIAAVMVDK